MGRVSLKIAGWCALVNALLTIPMFLVSLRLEDHKGQLAQFVEGGMATANAGLFLAIILLLKRFLNRRFGFHETDKVIGLQIIAVIILTGISIADAFIPVIHDALGMVYLLGTIMFGALQIAFGMKLQKLPQSLNGLRTPYCWLTMATGLCQASIVLLPVALLPSAVADVMLATIFFQSASLGNEQH